MKRFKFTKQQRITTRAEYQAILQQGKKVSDNNFRIAVAFNSEIKKPKLGIIVSKKIGTAVERNRIKRRVREIFRLNQHNFVAGTKLIIIAKPECVTKKYQELERSILTLLARVNGVTRKNEM
ncbi:MAG: ribonuclease P protein component [bacterium]|nr:ribonuclease P protein component [bacterium]